MGVVYKAQDIQLGRLVALKVLPHATSDDEEAVERFRREARTASSLNHSNICTIYSFEDHGGQLFLAMELLDGEPLDRKLAGKPLDLRALLDLGTQIADALDAAHCEGVLHRDIKPANIFVTRRGQVKVLDFGLAKLAAQSHMHDSSSNPTERFSSMAGTTVGTIAYMSPEQARGEEVDPRTDLFSFGVVLYEMATGRQSFPGATTAVVFDGILNRDPMPPSTLNAAIPVELDRIISKALEKDRGLRYQTAADMRADLQRLKRDSGSRRVAAAATTSAAPVPSPSDIGTMYPSAAYSTASQVSDGEEPTHMGDLSQILAPATSVEAPPAGPVEAARSVTPGRWSPLTLAAAVLFLFGLAAMSGVAWLMLATPTDTLETAPPQTSGAAPPPAPSEVPAPPTPQVVPPTPETAAPMPPPATPGVVAPAPSVGAVAAPGVVPPRNGTPSRAVRPTPGPLPSTTNTATAAATAVAAAAEAAAKAEAEINQRLEGARAKLAANQHDAALADLRFLAGHVTGSTAATVAFMTADTLEKLGRVDEAITAYSDFTSRYTGDNRGATSRLRIADLVLRTKRADRETVARQRLGEVFTNYPRTPQALEALQSRLRLDGNQRQREMDPILGTQVPAVLPTLRALTEQFPDASGAMIAFNRLAGLYIDLEQWARAAQALTELATRFPNNPNDAWFRLGELYERRFRDIERARAAYAQVPPASARYRDAQRKVKEL